ncbi:MAG TPA: hypothetical protein VEU30_02875 [Thermoanaerobaculia bacterium]|nr:hypothetical protein [Thermoanaerobaculia bacterium]
MIKVDRPAPEPAEVREALAKPFKKTGKTEIELAREYYAAVPRPTKAYEFARYKEFEVCRELDRLFHEKCAYCESSYRAVDARDIEHFRPKAKINEKPDHPGYWWLAAVWTNLLPSCPPCNQLRRHCAFDPGMTLEEFEKARQRNPVQTSGKANSFPVRGQWIDDEHGDVAAEDPLLINPTARRPEDHIEWVFDWDRASYLWEAEIVVALVRPKVVGGADDPYGKASIGVYGLNRAGLVRERMARVKDLQMACAPVVDVIEDIGNAQTPDQVAALHKRLLRYRKSAVEYTKPEKPYAGMARAFLAELERELARLAASTP